MGKHEPNSAKAIANKQKAKSLGKLAFYCQMCEKQCRDANGFKCHQMSEAHIRQMQLFAANPQRELDKFSQNFERGFLDILKRRHTTKSVLANTVYNEYVQDRDHVHMNSTVWESLTAFVQYLGRSGICEVEETERGWYIAYIDRDPKAMARQEAMKRKDEKEQDEEDRQRQELEKQVEIARKAAVEKGLPTRQEVTGLVRRQKVGNGQEKHTGDKYTRQSEGEQEREGEGEGEVQSNEEGEEDSVRVCFGDAGVKATSGGRKRKRGTKKRSALLTTIASQERDDDQDDTHADKADETGHVKDSGENYHDGMNNSGETLKKSRTPNIDAIRASEALNHEKMKKREQEERKDREQEEAQQPPASEPTSSTTLNSSSSGKFNFIGDTWLAPGLIVKITTKLPINGRKRKKEKGIVIGGKSSNSIELVMMEDFESVTVSSTQVRNVVGKVGEEVMLLPPHALQGEIATIEQIKIDEYCADLRLKSLKSPGNDKSNTDQTILRNIEYDNFCRADLDMIQ